MAITPREINHEKRNNARPQICEALSDGDGHDEYRFCSGTITRAQRPSSSRRQTVPVPSMPYPT